MTPAPTSPPSPVRRLLGFEWPAHVTSAERRSLIAGGLGWMLDAMDVSLYALVLVRLQAELGMDNTRAGSLATLTLLASALGGLLFGILADRIGRSRSLMASILVYSLASGACGFATSVTMLAVFRFVLGLGMGGEWSTGATLIAETWSPQHRGKALGLMQSTYAIGEMAAAGVVALVIPFTEARWPGTGWRAVFWVGVLPALFVLWIRRSVPEPALWTERRAQPGAFAALWRDRELRRNALVATAMNALGMFGYWGLFTWIPKYLGGPVEQGGRGLDLLHTTTWLIVLGLGKFAGYVLFGFFSDRFGRRRSYVVYLVVAAGLVPLYATASSSGTLLVLGPFVAFFGTGFFSGYSALAAELFPTSIRATAMGFSYNIGRGVGAIAPTFVGWLADARGGFTAAFLVLAGAYLLAGALAATLPESRAQALA